MDRRKRLSGRGFTLIEVTLAIVIGVIMIAGATLLYNQSKISSGNSRAQAKVLALQQLVEEYAANNAGTYPDIESVRSLWKRKRPDDYLKSPWGGQLGSHLQNGDDAAGTRGVANNSTTVSAAKGDKATIAESTSNAAPWKGDTSNCFSDPNDCNNKKGINIVPDGSVPLKDQPKSGGLSYSLNNAGGGSATNNPDFQNNTETQSMWDVVTNVTKIVRGYAVWVYDQQGQYPNFVTGGKPQ